MTDHSSECPVNKWRVNQLALRWLRQAKADVSPWSAYLPQLASWGLEKGGLEISEPLSPSQPTQSQVTSMLALLEAPGTEKALRATEWILSNPNLSRPEQTNNLVVRLTEPSSPEEAAQVVLDTMYDRMVAASSSSQE
jgi:hypothetical protein